MHPNPELKNIIFDLGGVILNLNVNRTLEAFLELGFPKELLSYPENFYTDVFHKYETGKSNTEEFRNDIRQLAKINFDNQDFDAAWCGMLAGIPFRRTEILQELSKNYKLYILSNTSPLHIDFFSEMFEQVAGFPLEKVFTKCYYSHEIGLHKPDPETYKHVLSDAQINAEETLFLDDNIHNVKAAEELNIQVIHITPTRPMESIGFNL